MKEGGNVLEPWRGADDGSSAVDIARQSVDRRLAARRGGKVPDLDSASPYEGQMLRPVLGIHLPHDARRGVKTALVHCGARREPETCAVNEDRDLTRERTKR